MKILKKTGPVEGISVYSDNEIVANDCNVTLPEITFATADVSAMGTMSLPLASVIEDMETSITKVGIDKNLVKITAPGSHSLEYRWVQDEIGTDGATKAVGCKAFMNVVPVTIHPGASLEIGSSAENDLTFKVTRYKLVVDGEVLILIDRLAHKLEVNGKDYTTSYNKYL